MGADAFAFRPILGQSARCRGSHRRPAIPSGPPPVLRSGRSTPPTGGQRRLCRLSGGRADALPGRRRSSKADASAGSQHGRGRSCGLDTFFDPLGRGPWAKANRISVSSGRKSFSRSASGASQIVGSGARGFVQNSELCCFQKCRRKLGKRRRNCLRCCPAATGMDQNAARGEHRNGEEEHDKQLGQT